MKLEVGMYVRTEKGMIAKIISKEDVSGSLHKEEIVFILDDGNRLALNSRKVTKLSHNIIDLIEEGDYVNGDLVTFISSNPKKNQRGKHRIILNDSHSLFGKYDDIKSIVTKEQFESMKYEVK